jgi:serine/threonine-protein kinase SRPK3
LSVEQKWLAGTARDLKCHVQPQMLAASSSSLRTLGRLHVKIAPLNLSRCQVSRSAFISTVIPDAKTTAKIPFDQSSTSVRINDKDDGEEFICDEEPHMLSSMLGHGYYPLTLGQKLGDGKFEIVRKLGWASNSSVWLARTLGYVLFDTLPTCL